MNCNNEQIQVIVVIVLLIIILHLIYILMKPKKKENYQTDYQSIEDCMSSELSLEEQKKCFNYFGM